MNAKFKVSTSVALPYQLNEALNEKAEASSISRSKLISIGTHIICGIENEVLNKINRIAAVLNTDSETIITNLLTARVAKIDCTENDANKIEMFPELVSEKLDLNTFTNLFN